MTMRLRFLMLLSFILMFVSACNTVSETTATVTEEETEEKETAMEETGDLTNLKKIIQGRWVWEKTECCGRTKQTIYPDEKNPVYVYIFKEDNIVEKISEEGREVLRYKIHYSDIYPGRPFISIGESPRPALIQVLDNQLIINYGYIDLQTEYYKRQVQGR